MEDERLESAAGILKRKNSLRRPSLAPTMVLEDEVMLWDDVEEIAARTDAQEARLRELPPALAPHLRKQAPFISCTTILTSSYPSHMCYICTLPLRSKKVLEALDFMETEMSATLVRFQSKLHNLSSAYQLTPAAVVESPVM